MSEIRIALAQINVTVGDLDGNLRKVCGRLSEASEAGAQLVVFPELAISGYPPEDLLLKPSFLRACRQSLE
ncbi:MAG: nitrilase-related carbon-nitrogen hydrolase, partial [Candidatus Binatia bacterium]